MCVYSTWYSIMGSQSERDRGGESSKGWAPTEERRERREPCPLQIHPGSLRSGTGEERERVEGPKEVIADSKGKTTHVSDIASKKEDCSAYYLEREVSLAELLAGKAGPFPRKQRIL